MAVYTRVSEADVTAFLYNYDIGTLVELAGIKTGTSNSNYRLRTDRGLYVLTLYEGGALDTDLDFFIGLMEQLAGQGIACPLPIRGQDGAARRVLAQKSAVIVTHLPGASLNRIEPEDCRALGVALAGLHQAGAKVTLTRRNDLSLDGWDRLFALTEGEADSVQVGLAATIGQELHFLRRNWPQHLPSGIIHADLFPDNVLCDHGSICGLIDFNFACNDILAYDLAICMNAWCFEGDHISFNMTKARAMVRGYASVRPLSAAELSALPVLARGAAIRFLVRRLYDWLHQVPGALVKAKDPLDYLRRLTFHQRVQDCTAYGLDL